MGLWSGIKYALNSSLGTDKFEPLDVTIGKKLDIASATAASSMFSWLKDVWDKVVSININAQKRPSTLFYTYDANTPVGTTTILSVEGKGMLRSLGATGSTAASSSRVYIYADGVLKGAAIPYPTTSAAYVLVLNKTTNTFSFVLATATLTLIQTTDLNINYVGQLMITMSVTSMHAASQYINYTKEV